MKVTVNEIKKPYLEFPKLMISTDKKILIIATEIINGNIKGMVINNNTWPFGYSARRWGIDSFIDFNGSITLENE